MTEFDADIEKFKTYLNERYGTRVLALGLFVESCGDEFIGNFGTNEMCGQMAISIIAHVNGLSVRRG